MLKQIFCCLAFIALPLYAESTPTPFPSPPPLPAVSEGENAGLLVNSSNANEFRSLIIPEFYPLVRARLITMDAVSSLRVDLDNFKPQALKDGKLDEEALNINGIINENARLKAGFPFPDWEDEKDLKRKAFKFVWNMQSVWWNLKVISSDFTISYIQEAKAAKQLKGVWQRVYPGIVSSEDKSIQIFRELLQFSSPGILKGLKYLTFRFKGTEEDMFWISSPALKKVRELTGSNRADSILDSSFSPDDLLGWSGKPELADVLYDKEVISLVPFSSYDLKTISLGADECDNYIKPPLTAPNSHWNYATHRFPDAFAWLPTDVVFTPRRLVRIELVPKDPFSLYGRQIIYVDKKLMIPYYKFVFNRAGYLWKTVFNIPVLLQTKDQARQYMFTDYILIEDRQLKTANIIEFDNAYFCKGFNEKIKLNNFDPQKLIFAPTPAPTPSKK